MPLIRNWIVILAALVVLSCTDVDREQVVGEYRGNFGKDSVVLYLKPNGEFVWLGKRADHPVTRHEGKWTFSTLKGGAGIVLREIRPEGGGMSQQHDVQSLLGRVMIVVDSDKGWSLRRQ